MAGDCFSTQIISRDGEFDAAAMQRFSNSIKLPQCGVSYTVVAIIGPQSSGKSTLFNHLFGTNFAVMDTEGERKQTTKGVWIAKAVGIEPPTLVMDMEGTDSQERGDQDDTTFEKQSALFALAVADIVIINMWCHDIGRESAANRPLQKTVFEVMMSMFKPSKKTLLYIIRDKTKTRFDHLDSMLRKDIQKIWEALPKTPTYKDTPLSEIFNVEVTALSSYEDKEKQFKAQVAQLRQQFVDSTFAGRFARDKDVVPISAFFYSTQEKWKKIKENRVLNLPAHKIMVSAVLCEQIANEKLKLLASDKDWLALEQAVRDGSISGFGKRASAILETYLSEYDKESQYFDEGVRNSKRQDLESKALQLFYPSYKNILRQLHLNSLRSFKSQLQEHLDRGEGFAAAVRTCQMSSTFQFNQGRPGVSTKQRSRIINAAIEQANRNASKVCEKLQRDIEDHASLVRNEKLADIEQEAQKKLSEALEEAVERHFDKGGQYTWALIRSLLDRESKQAGSALSDVIAEFELGQTTVEKKVLDLKEYSRKLVEELSRKRAAKAEFHMKTRFFRVVFNKKDEHELDSVKTQAIHECLKLLSTLAVIRLDERTDNVEDVLFSALMSDIAVSGDPLASTTWNNVPPEKTLITPIQCRALWEEFMKMCDSACHEGQKVHETLKGNGRKTRLWFIVALILLGVSAFTLFIYASGNHDILRWVMSHLLGVGALVFPNPKMYKKVSDYVKGKTKDVIKEIAEDVMRELKQLLIKFYEYIKSIIKSTIGQFREDQPMAA